MAMPTSGQNQIPSWTVASTEATQPNKTQASPADAKAAHNVAIIQASLDVAISAKNEPLALLLKAAINNINDILKPQFGENAIQNAASQDNTPEGTAGRIVSLSTGFFELYQQQHTGEPAADVFKQFMQTIRGGFEKGFKEAKGILDGMGVLNGDIASNIDKTYALVQKGYADFEAAHGGDPSTATTAARKPF